MVAQDRSQKFGPDILLDIVLGDMNAHDVLWNSSVQANVLLKEIKSLLEDGRFHLLNAPDQTTFGIARSPKNPSVIDLTLVASCFCGSLQISLSYAQQVYNCC